MLTFDTLPAGARLRLWVTGTRVVEGHDGDWYDESGWVDLGWSAAELHESRNDVRPLLVLDELDEWSAGDLRDHLEACNVDVGRITGGAVQYGTDPIDGTMLACHLVAKYYDQQAGWYEDDVDIADVLRRLAEVYPDA